MEGPLSEYITLVANDCGYLGNTKEMIVNWVHPLFLKAKSMGSAENIHNWRQVIEGWFANEYWEATKTGMQTLEKKEGWTVVDCEDNMNIIRSTWVLKLKRYPYGLIKQFKARVCA